MKRIILIGDIHGCYSEWEELLRKIEFDSRKDKLILLGDLIDRGKDSYRVFQKAVVLQKEMGDDFILLRGSHEKLLLDNSKKWKDRILWRIVGKGATIRSFREHGGDLKECENWFKIHSHLYYESDKFQCAHAGVRKEKLADNDEYTLLMDHGWVRKNLYHGKLTITGHIHLKEPMWFDATERRGKPLKYQRWMQLPQLGTICIDTGCAEGNALTAMIIKDNKFYLECVNNKCCGRWDTRL